MVLLIEMIEKVLSGTLPAKLILIQGMTIQTFVGIELETLNLQFSCFLCKNEWNQSNNDDTCVCTFVDNVETKAKQLLNYILQSNAGNSKAKICYLASERIFPKTKSILHKHSNTKLINLTPDVTAWTDTSDIGDLKKILQELNKKGAVLIFDSLSYLVLQYGVKEIYKWFNELITNKQGELLSNFNRLKYIKIF